MEVTERGYLLAVEKTWRKRREKESVEGRAYHPYRWIALFSSKFVHEIRIEESRTAY